jgi:hypothetical protein
VRGITSWSAGGVGTLLRQSARSPQARRAGSAAGRQTAAFVVPIYSADIIKGHRDLVRGLAERPASAGQAVEY